MINLIFLCELENTSFYITYQVKCADLYTVGKSKKCSSLLLLLIFLLDLIRYKKTLINIYVYFRQNYKINIL